MTGYFLKLLDSVRKSIASALEIFVDVVLTFLLFSIPITSYTVLAASLVAGGVWLYSVPKLSREETGEGGEKAGGSGGAAVGKTNGGAAVTVVTHIHPHTPSSSAVVKKGFGGEGPP